MNLTEQPEIVSWPATHYVFVEKVGSFMQTAPAAWGEAHGLLPALMKNNTIEKYMSLYRIAAQVYRAGFAIAAPPVELPDGMRYELFAGGAYARFVLTGPYTELGPATGRVMQILEERKIALRDDFSIEHYVNDPRVTPTHDLKTEILAPVA